MSKQKTTTSQASPRISRHYAIVNKIMDILVMHDVKIGEVEGILQRVRTGIGWTPVQPHVFEPEIIEWAPND